MKWKTIENTFCKVAFVIIFLGCVSVLWEWYYDLRIKLPEIVIIESGWHLPEIEGYVAEIRYKKL